MAKKSCSKCKKEFDCGKRVTLSAVEGCWCENYQLSADTLQHLKEVYANCLCKDCLAAFAVVAPSR